MKQAVLCLAALISVHVGLQGQIIVADNYDVAGSGTGFALGSGVNSGITPSATRLTGSLATDLRYIQTFAGKTNTAYSITANTLRVAASANPGRFALSADGTNLFNFSSALGAASATALKPAFYDVTISMANNSAGTQRFSFGIGTAEGDVTTWDFGLQLYRGTNTLNFYTLQKRIDTNSCGLADINAPITSTAAGTWGSMMNFLLRFTDAGAESGTFNSRVQISMDGGDSFFYDTESDSTLVNGWGFDTLDRYFLWDIAGNAVATYDNFSVTVVPVPEPSAIALAGLAGTMLFWLRRRGVR